MSTTRVWYPHVKTLAVGQVAGKRSSGQYTSGLCFFSRDSVKSGSFSLEDDFKEFFRNMLLALLVGRYSLTNKGSEFERLNGVVGGFFLSFFLSAPRWMVELGVLGICGGPAHFHDRTGWPPMAWIKTMLWQSEVSTTRLTAPGRVEVRVRVRHGILTQLLGQSVLQARRAE